MNQNPEQPARDLIDDQLTACGWILQDKKSINLAEGCGVAIREYQTDAGPADYLLFVNSKPIRLIEAISEEHLYLTMVEGQHTGYTSAKLKYIKADLLSFLLKRQQNNVQEIESRLSVCDKMEKTNTNSLKQVEALLQSILKMVFEGNVTL